MEIENDLKTINEKIGEILEGANFWKFSYSGIYTLEFSLNRQWYGYNFINIDIDADINISIFKPDKSTPKKETFSIKDFNLIWSKNVVKAQVNNNLALSLFFEDGYCCEISSKINDPKNLTEFRWCIYQKLDMPSFYVSVSDEENIYLQMP